MFNNWGAQHCHDYHQHLQPESHDEDRLCESFLQNWKVFPAFSSVLIRNSRHPATAYAITILIDNYITFSEHTYRATSKSFKDKPGRETQIGLICKHSFQIFLFDTVYYIYTILLICTMLMKALWLCIFQPCIANWTMSRPLSVAFLFCA